MLDKLDDIIKRFVAVFLFPLINMLILISITYVATSTDTNKMSSKINVFVTTVLRTSTNFIQSNLADISTTLEKYQGAVQTIASASAVALVFTFVLAIYLIDRAIYYFGRFAWPNFEFDLNSYGGKTAEGRILALKKVFEKTCDVATCYGAIRAYLGHKNADQYRLNQRNKFVKGIETAKTVLAYTKAYVVYWLFVFVSALWGEQISWGGASFALALLFVVGFMTVRYLSSEYRRLINYDLDSFIWDRTYSTERLPDIEAVSHLKGVDKRPKRSFADFLRERWYLKVVFLAADP